MNKRILACIAAAVFVLGGCASQNTSDGGNASDSSAAVSAADGGAEDGSSGEEKSANEETEKDEPQLIEFSQPSGVYAEGFSLELKGTEDGDIYYTTDGSDPASSESRVRYEAPVEIKDRSGEPNVVSAVSPELISGNFVKYDRETNTFPTTVEAPADSAVDKCSTISVVLIKPDGSISPVYTRTYFIGSISRALRKAVKRRGKALRSSA